MIGQKNRRFKKCLSLLLTIMMLVTIVPIPVSAETAEAPEVETMQALDYVEAPQASDKITEEVKEDMQSGDAVEIIVYMKDKLDSIAFAEKALAKHSKKMSQYEASLQVRRDLVLALKDQTHRTQYSLRQLVKSSGDKVEDFESFFIANVAYMKVSSDLVEKIAALPEVEKITKNGTYYLDDYIVEDTVAPQEGENLWNLDMVRAPETWGVGIDGTGAVVGLLDSGVNYNHPALHDKWRGLSEDGTEDATYSWKDTVANEPLPVDSDTHGTHVTGTMVGQDEANNITTGVAPGAKWICARVFNPAGSTTDFQLLQAAEWMVNPGDNPDMAPDAVNNSWGGGSAADDWYLEAVDNYIAAGIVPVFSAGNQRQGEPLPQPGSISNPAHYTDVVAVAAIDKNKLRAEWSKRGPSPYTDNWKPDISAPGVGVFSSMSDGSYGNMSGTSMAAPHITGSVALLRSANKALTVDQIKDMLFQNTEPLTDSDPNAQESPNHDYGYGLVDTLESCLPVSSGVGTFTGKVLVEGSDAGPPTLEHEQTVFELYLGSAIRVEAYASDDTSLVDVSLMVKPANEGWNKVSMTQIDGDYKSGNYAGTIMPADMGVDDFQYKVVAEDYVGNITEVGPFDVALEFGVVPGEYIESFEGEALGWAMDPLWEIGPKTDDGEPEPVDGEQYIATNIGGKYGAEEDALLVSAPIDMRNTADASVRFFHWHAFHTTTNDKGTIYVTNDFGETLQEYGTFHMRSGEWLGEVIDLRPYAYSATPVYVLFHFTSNKWSHDYGWYIDQFSVEGKDTTPPDAPTNLEAQAGLSAINLSWDFNMVPDFGEFLVYRSTVAGTLGELIGTSISQTYADSNENLEADTDYYYTVKAADIFDNISGGSNQVHAQKGNSNVVIAWDFEANNGNFVLDPTSSSQNDWEWGEVGSGHGPGAAYSGSKVWATGLDKDYGSKRDAYLITPEFTVPADGASYLTMNHWFHFEQLSVGGRKWDYGQVLVKTSGSEEWVNITPEDEVDEPGEGKFGGPYGRDNPGPDNWRYEEIPLEDFAGQTIQLSFFYHTDGGGFRAGWFINDVNIVNVPSTAAIPDGSHYAEPANIEAEIADFSIDIATVGLEEIPEFEQEDVGLDTIPALNAHVTVEETGKSVASSNRTGVYRLMHMASEEGETYTLTANAYGYVPQSIETELLDGQTVVHNFILEKMATGTITGKVFDRYSHDPAPNAVVRVVEDPNIAPVVADANGNFTIENVYIGEYTLHAAAENFESGTVEVTVEAGQTTTVDIPLKRFVGVPGEIIYDDGSAENATVLRAAGNGVGMRFTPEKFGKLLNASYYFWGDEWPVPGGNEIGFAVFVKDGIGYKQIGETKIVDDIVRGDWYTIDLSDLNFTTDEDFYVTTIQPHDGNHSPGHGLDEDASQDAIERSCYYVDGDFQDFASQGKNYAAMVRCTMMYAAETPVITNLEDLTYTNQDSIDVEGIVNYDEGQVLVYADDVVDKIIEPEDIEDFTFATTVDLVDEETNIKASLKVGERETEPSEEKLVIKDQIAPDLVVNEPYDGEQLNVELVHVKGTVTDKYFDNLTINGVEVPVEEDGSYDYKLILEQGENPIEVRAIDKAGNESIEDRIVYVRAGGEVRITDMQPAADVVVAPYEAVEVSFRAPAGGNASYEVVRPFGPQSVELDAIPMTEVEPGYYEAIWFAGDIEFEDAEVRFDYKDEFNNRVRATAPGKISVVKPEPIERLEGSNRYATAAEMSKRLYEQSDIVVLASGEDFPDTLVGGLYSYKIDAPILLTRKADLPDETKAEIKRLGATEVKILGGELAISADVEETLTDNLGLITERIFGSNRFKTAVEVNERFRYQDSTHVYLTSGYRYEDALSIVPVAAGQGDPILLTDVDKLHSATRAALSRWNTESITIVGGPLAVSKEVEQELKDTGYIVTREAGSNAYATNISIARKYYPYITKVIGASGADFADAMISTAFATKTDRPIILLDPEGLRDDTIRYFETQPIEHVMLIGGDLAIPKAIEYHIRALIQ